MSGKIRYKKKSNINDKKIYKRSKNKNGDEKLVRLFQRVNIKVTIIIGFIILVLLILIIGNQTYSQSSKGFIENYESSMKNTLTMSSEAINIGLEMINSASMDLYSERLILDYGSPVMQKNVVLRDNTYKDVKNILVTKQSVNKFIKDIFIIYPDDTYCPMTSGGNNKSLGSDLYNPFLKEIGSKSSTEIRRGKWIAPHKILEEKIKDYKNTSAGSLIRMDANGKSLIVIDINIEAIRERLLKIDIEPEISLSYISADGLEIKRDESSEYSFVGKDYLEKVYSSPEAVGSEYIENGEYLFLYSKMNNTDGIICARVPRSLVVKEAEVIKKDTISLMIVACIIVILIGLLITLVINTVTKDIVVKLKRLESGDLTVKLNTSSVNEFGKVAIYVQSVIDSLLELIINTRNIIKDVNGIAQNISRATYAVEKSVADINTSIEGITTGGMEQAEETTASLVKMDSLSEKMIKVQSSVENMQAVSSSTNEMIDKSLGAMQNMEIHSKNTINVTIDVKNKIKELSKQTNEINNFTNNIRGIAEQTTILSLNASIEAARAGQAGKGFSVVAGEIKKLANITVESSKQVDETVKSILNMTNETVEVVIAAEEFVKKQDGIVADTKNTFTEMRTKINKLIDNINGVSDEIQLISGDRASTLNSLENITSLSEEIAASTAVVGNNIGEQKDEAESLKGIADDLIEGMKSLTEAISTFKIE